MAVYLWHCDREGRYSLQMAVAGSDARLTSQIAIPAAACDAVFAADSGYAQSISNLASLSLDTDGVFGDGWSAELATVTGSRRPAWTSP